MAINITYAPAAGLVGQAGYLGGLADYNQKMRQNQIAQQELIQRDRMQSRGIAAQNYQQAYGAADAQYRQRVGIADQQTEQLRDLANKQVIQANDIANQQYMQQQSLENSRLNTMMEVASRQQNLQATLAYHANAASQGYAANQQSQLLAGEIRSGLQAQQTAQQMGLSDQHFAQQAWLADQRANAAIDINAANLQNQLDFMPQFTQAQYQAKQSEIAQRGQALQDALANDIISPQEFQIARNNLFNEQVGLAAKRPSRSDVALDYESRVVTPDPNYIIPGSITPSNPRGEPVRYLKNDRGGFDMDPHSEMMFKQSQVQMASQERASGKTSQMRLERMKIAAQTATEQARINLAVPWQVFYQNALTAIMESAKEMAGQEWIGSGGDF